MLLYEAYSIWPTVLPIIDNRYMQWTQHSTFYNFTWWREQRHPVCSMQKVFQYLGVRNQYISDNKILRSLNVIASQSHTRNIRQQCYLERNLSQVEDGLANFHPPANRRRWWLLKCRVSVFMSVMYRRAPHWRLIGWKHFIYVRCLKAYSSQVRCAMCTHSPAPKENRLHSQELPSKEMWFARNRLQPFWLFMETTSPI
jgi:hypothetical protein